MRLVCTDPLVLLNPFVMGHDYAYELLSFMLKTGILRPTRAIHGNCSSRNNPYTHIYTHMTHAHTHIHICNKLASVK